MFKLILIATVVVTCCGQNIPVTPPRTPPAPLIPLAQPVRCGEIPKAIFGCLGNPKLVKPEISAQCTGTKYISECERIKCIFKKSGWMKKDQVDRAKVIAHFEQFAKDQPAWFSATEYVKVACLSTDLPAQGVYIGCPQYDIIHCAISAFFKNAQPSQWSQSPDCRSPRQYAAACPICPEDCFVPAIPFGSCNACRLLPTTP